MIDAALAFLLMLAGQLQSPALAFLIGGMALSAFGSRLQIPNAVYQFAVFMLLMRIGISGGLAIREAELLAMLLPAAMTMLLGSGIVLAGATLLPLLPGVRRVDGVAIRDMAQSVVPECTG